MTHTQPVYAEGYNGQIWFDGFFITLTRRGFLARVHVGRGDKRIPITAVQAVQWKDAGLTLGFIQLTLPGGNERRSSFGSQSSTANYDENSVTFTPQEQPAFEQVRSVIEQAIQQRAGAAYPPPPTLPPAGWYADPKGQPVQRWWDGQQWTEHTHQQERAPG